MRTYRKDGIEVTEDEYIYMREEYYSACLNCRSIIEGDCEPDMREGPCENCEKDMVMGIEEMLMEGRITFI
jgi:hypothetical protein